MQVNKNYYDENFGLFTEAVLDSGLKIYILEKKM